MRRLTIFLLATFLLFPAIANAIELPTRVSGTNRFETAVKVSVAGWPSGTNTVLIANGQDFPDALAGAPLAYKLNAPILLTEKNKLETVTQTEIKRLKATKAIILGGQGAVSQTVENSIKSMGLTVERIAGQDRFETAFEIAKKVGLDQNKVVLANGLNFPDALGIAPYAARNGFPILLTRSDVLPEQTVAALTYARETLVVGGTGVVSAGIYSDLPVPQRISGANRFETVAQIVRTLQTNTSKVYIATGYNFADALTGSVLAAKQNVPIILVEPTSVPAAINALKKDKGITNFNILGGSGAVGDKVLWDLVLEKNLYGRKIMLDPGHGGRDPGAVRTHSGTTYYERDLNWQITQKIQSKLTALGATVMLTPRPKDSTVKVSLQERALYANAQKPELFVSIHHDASTDSTVKGVSTHYSSYRPAIETKDVYVTYNGGKYPFISESTDENNKGFYINYKGTTKLVDYNENGILAFDPTPSLAAIKSKSLAEAMVAAVASTGLVNKGSVDHNLYVTRWTAMPSVLIEVGFISNPDDVKSAADPTKQDLRAGKIVDSIRSYFN